MLLDPEAPAPAAGALLLEGGRIAGKLPVAAQLPQDCPRVDLGGRALAPGFIDLHHHGSLVLARPGRFAAALAHDAASCARHGTTAFLPTTVALPAPDLLRCVEELAAACGSPTPPGAAVPLGLHLEGPWISAACAGAQPMRGIRDFDAREASELFSRAAGGVRMLTLAPELPGSPALLDELARRGIVAAVGHSRADAAALDAAVERGLRHVTHLFNAMSGLHHRERGVAGYALTDDRLSCDLICDGAHVHPAIVRLAARAKRERLLLISDRIELPPESRAEGFGAGPVHDDGTAWRLSDGRLAASRIALAEAARNAQRFGAMTQLEAVVACTLAPAVLLGIEAQHGTLRPGARADLVVLEPDGALAATWIAGRPVGAA